MLLNIWLKDNGVPLALQCDVTDRTAVKDYVFKVRTSLYHLRCNVIITGEIGGTKTKLALKVLRLKKCWDLTAAGLVCLLDRIEANSLT